MGPEGGPKVEKAPGRRTNVGRKAEATDQFRPHRLRNAGRPSAPRKNPANATKRLDEQLERAKRLFEYGEYDWATFCARRDEIQQHLSQLAEAAAKPDTVDLDWCEAQLIDLVAAWEAADSRQRSRLVSGIFEQLEAEALLDNTIRVVAIPREGMEAIFRGFGTGAGDGSLPLQYLALRKSGHVVLAHIENCSLHGL
jgi:hypothetical protein